MDIVQCGGIRLKARTVQCFMLSDVFGSHKQPAAAQAGELISLGKNWFCIIILSLVCIDNF